MYMLVRVGSDCVVVIYPIQWHTPCIMAVPCKTEEHCKPVRVDLFYNLSVVEFEEIATGEVCFFR